MNATRRLSVEFSIREIISALKDKYGGQSFAVAAMPDYGSKIGTPKVSYDSAATLTISWSQPFHTDAEQGQ